jgi:hypothetical protein
MITVTNSQLPDEILDAQHEFERFVRTRPQENDFLLYNTHVYQMNSGINRWIVAREYCRAQVVTHPLPVTLIYGQGADLVSINSVDELDWLMAHFPVLTQPPVAEDRWVKRRLVVKKSGC